MLMKEINDYGDFMNSCTKIISFLPPKVNLSTKIKVKDSGLFDVHISKGINHENFRMKILRRDFSQKEVECQDFVKDRDLLETLPPLKPSKDDAALSKIVFQSVASSINTSLEKFARTVARYLEGKTKLTIGELQLEVVVDGHANIWLIGSRGIHFFDPYTGLIDKTMDKRSITFPKTIFKKHHFCPGAYCDYVGDTFFKEDGDEAVELYV
jgi:hypothetical protein